MTEVISGKAIDLQNLALPEILYFIICTRTKTY